MILGVGVISSRRTAVWTALAEFSSGEFGWGEHGVWRGNIKEFGARWLQPSSDLVKGMRNFYDEHEQSRIRVVRSHWGHRSAHFAHTHDAVVASILGFSHASARDLAEDVTLQQLRSMCLQQTKYCKGDNL